MVPIKRKIMEYASYKADLAIREGIVKPEKTCMFCGDNKSKIHGHHPDYRHPLELVWLCPKCHFRLHYGHFQVLPPSHFQSEVEKKHLYELVEEEVNSRLRCRGICKGNMIPLM